MPLMRKYERNGVVVALWNITESLENLVGLSREDSVAAAMVFASEQRRQEWLAVRLLLKEIVGEGASIEYDSCGKPFLLGVEGYISISHTRGWAGLAFSRLEPMGLDIECADRGIGRVASRFMCEEELLSLPGEWWNNYKLLRWTVSEALFKLVGNLGGSYRENIEVGQFVPSESGSVNVSIVGLEGCASCGYVVDFFFENNLLVTICRNGSCGF